MSRSLPSTARSSGSIRCLPRATGASKGVSGLWRRLEVASDDGLRLLRSLAEHRVAGMRDHFEACLLKQASMLCLHRRSDDFVAGAGQEQDFMREALDPLGQIQDDLALVVLRRGE